MPADYGGLRGAYRYAFAASSSLLFKSYVVISALAGAFVAVLLVLGTVSWLANPTGLVGEHAFLWVLGLLVLVPLTVPVLVVARRHRLGDARPREEHLLGLAGCLFILSWYLGLIVADPREHDVSGPFGQVVAVLDTLPELWSLGFFAAGAGLVTLAVWGTGD